MKSRNIHAQWSFHSRTSMAEDHQNRSPDRTSKHQPEVCTKRASALNPGPLQGMTNQLTLGPRVLKSGLAGSQTKSQTGTMVYQCDGHCRLDTSCSSLSTAVSRSFTGTELYRLMWMHVDRDTKLFCKTARCVACRAMLSSDI